METWIGPDQDEREAIAAHMESRGLSAEQCLLVRDGEWCPAAMKRQRITREEVESAMRSEGVRDVASAAAVILESDGTVSVISRGG